jgi:hypothetical protein
LKPINNSMLRTTRLKRRKNFFLNVSESERKISFMFKTELEDTRDNGKDSFRSLKEKDFILQEGSKCVRVCVRVC